MHDTTAPPGVPFWSAPLKIHHHGRHLFSGWTV